MGRRSQISEINPNDQHSAPGRQEWRGGGASGRLGSKVRALALEMNPEMSNGQRHRARVSKCKPAGSVQSTAMQCLIFKNRWTDIF